MANQQFFHLGTFNPVTSTTTEAPIKDVTSFNNNSGFRHGKQTKETKEVFFPVAKQILNIYL